MRCSDCQKKISARWSVQTSLGRLCPKCAKENCFTFGSPQYLPIIDVPIDPLPPGLQPGKKE
jgi:hypothetical protein